MSEKNTRSTKRTKKTSKLWSQFKVFYAFFVMSSLTVLGVVFYQLYQNFQSTMTWEKNTSAPIAEVEPYTLYLTDEDHKQIVAYNNIYTKIYDSTNGTFKETASNETITEFNSVYEKMSDTLKERELFRYKQINDLWTVKTEYDLLFEDLSTLKETTSPLKIQAYIDSNGKTIKKYLEDNNDTSKKALLTHIYDSLNKLSSDTANISEMFTIFDATFNVTNTSVKVKKDVSSQQLNKWNDYKSSLNYKWNIIDKHMSPIVDKSTSILSKHDAQIGEYNLYKKSKDDKNSYELWLKDYQETKNNLVDYKDFTGKKYSEILEWANENNITIQVTKIDSYQEENTILTQTPNSYSKILKGTTISITIAQKIVETSSSSSSSSSSTSSTSSSSSSSSATSSSSSTRTETSNGG